MKLDEARRLVAEGNIDDRRYWEAKQVLPALEREAEQELSRDIAASVTVSMAREDAEWTREVTIERRSRWNAAVRSGRYGTKSVNVANLIRDMGFDASTLQRQVARHGL